MYYLELDRVAREIVDRGAERVLLQLPNGLRPYAFDMAAELEEKTGATVMISGDSCYGACDLALRPAEVVGAELLVHYGHSPLPIDTELPVIYIEARVDIDVEDLVEQTLPLLEGWERVALSAPIQHTHQLREVAERLEEHGLRGLIGEAKGRATNAGQVLGCYYGAPLSVEEEVDSYLFIGGGRFHPLGLALSTGKPVIAFNPYNATVTVVSEEEVKKLAGRRYSEILAAREAERIGVVVSLKPGQYVLRGAEELVDRLKEKGYESFIIVTEEVRAEHLNNFVEIEAFVNTACPRVAVDGIAGLSRPMITLLEARLMLGDEDWETVWGSRYLSYEAERHGYTN